MTVGVSSFAFAKTDLSKNLTTQKSISEFSTSSMPNGILRIETIKNFKIVNGMVVSCTNVVVYREYDINGNFVGESRDITESTGSNCAGGDGSINFTLIRFSNGFS